MVIKLNGAYRRSRRPRSFQHKLERQYPTLIPQDYFSYMRTELSNLYRGKRILVELRAVRRLWIW